MSGAGQQQRGQRKSPFIQRRMSLVEDGNPLLYPRYNRISEILLDSKEAAPSPTAASGAKSRSAAAASAVAAERPSAQAALLARAAAAEDRSAQLAQQAASSAAPQTEADGEVRKRKRDKPKKEKKQKQAAEEADTAVNGDAAAEAQVEDEQPRGKKKKKEKKDKAVAAEAPKQPSGPSNADEAASIRAALGFGPPPAAAAPASVPAAPAPAAGTFVFGFQPSPAAAAAESSSSKESDEEAASPVQPPQAPGNVPQEIARWAGGVPRPVPAIAKPAQPPSAPAEPGQGYVPRRVFVGGMPFSYDEEAVREYWAYCGAIESLDLMRFPDTGRFKGMAFITFADDAGYEAALACDGTELDGQTLRVDRCKAPKNRKAEAAAPKVHATPIAEKVPGYYVAYVGNIAFEADVSEVREVFTDCGVTQVRLHTDKESGRSKGYAHVHFPDEESLDKAVGLNGTELHGRNLKVGYAQRKKM